MKVAETFGRTATEEMAHFVKAQIYALKDVVEKEHIECEFELRRSYDVFKSEEDAREMDAVWKRDYLGNRYEWTRDVHWIGPDFAERLTSIEGAKGAFSVPACSFWPYKFVTGLLERSVSRNARLNLQTETPVLSVQTASDGSSVVLTARGSVTAKKVIFATNAYAAALLPEYRGVITPYKGTAAHLAAGNETEPVFPHLSHTYNIEFGRRPGLETVDYLNPRPDGGIVVGGAKWTYEKQKELWYDTVDDSTLLDPVMEAKYFDGYMQRNFKGWKDSGTEVDKVWTGSKVFLVLNVTDTANANLLAAVMGTTPDGAPHVGKVPGKQSQWILAGFNGGGNALVYLSAKAVAKMALDGVLFRDTGVEVPSLFETTEERLRVGQKDVESSLGGWGPGSLSRV